MHFFQCFLYVFFFKVFWLVFHVFSMFFECFFLIVFPCFLCFFECFFDWLFNAFCMLFQRFLYALPARGLTRQGSRSVAWRVRAAGPRTSWPLDEPPGPYGGAFWMHRHPSFLSERVTRSHAREGRGAAAAGRVQRSGPKTNRVQVTQVDFGSKWSGKNRFSVCLWSILGTLLAHILRHSGQL